MRIHCHSIDPDSDGMKRYYSHYTFIYPDVRLKNYVIELLGNRIVKIFPFEKEIANTEFYSGTLFFLPIDISYADVEKQAEKVFTEYIDNSYAITINTETEFKVYHDGTVLI